MQGEYINAKKKIKAYYKDGKLDGKYVVFFDEIGGKKKIEGLYKNGKKEGFWKYYNKDGKVINQKYYHDNKDCTAKYNRLKKIAAKRIEKEKDIEAKTGVETRLPKMTKGGKVAAIVKETMGLSK